MRILDLKALPLLVAAVLTLSAAGASAQPDEVLTLDIEAQKVGSALVRLAKSWGVQIVLSEGTGEKIEVEGLRGDYRFEDALATLLAGSGLAYEFASENLVVVQEMEQVAEPLEDAPVSAGEEAIEVTTVIGSRIRHDEFSSTTPVQIVDGRVSRELGLIDTASLLQSATQATGLQIDSSFTTFVLENGEGAAQINLRALGSQRALLLLNSRRLASSGAASAPTSPDLSTIPNVMIDRIEYLLDGASSIYGSDAVAGVANVIMRRDFDGFELEGKIVDPDGNGGGERALGIAWGKTGGNWTFGVAAESYDRQRVRLRDRAYTERCERYVYEDENGNSLSTLRGLAPGTTVSPCRLRDVNRVFIPIGYGNLWYTPGRTNVAIPNFSETLLPVGFTPFNPAAIVPIDQDGDGVPDTGLVDPDGDGLSDVDLQTDAYNYNGSDRDRASDLLPKSQRINVYSYGEYELGNASNTQAYFELLYANRKTEVLTPGASLFATVPADNPFNPCNLSQPAGVNCLGFFGYYAPGLEVEPVVVVRGDRDFNEVETDQIRVVVGMQGDLPGWRNNRGFEGWGYDMYFSYSASHGTYSQAGILERELTLSLETSVIDPVTGEITCGDGQPCVPVNLFAESLYQPGGGDFATRAERDFVFGWSRMDTNVYQSTLSGVVQGDVAALPWNNTSIPLVLGVEYRKDEVNSIPNEVAREGLLISSFGDGGAVGKRDITDVFMETELQLIENIPLLDLSLNLALRWTEENTYGSHTTYSARSVYTPFAGIAFRGTYGTSFRAPNTHEQFLAGTTGFEIAEDPCVVPFAARAPSLNPNQPATYRREHDPRGQTTLDNCRAHGVDPTALGLEGINTAYSVELLRKGGQQVQIEIDPETSTSHTYGVVLDPPLWDSFRLRIEVSYFNVHVENTITPMSVADIVNDCYVEMPNIAGDWCRFIMRDANGLLDQVESSFVNLSANTSRGIDYKVYFRRDIAVFDRSLNLELDVRATRLLESRFIVGDEYEIDHAATPVAPRWEGTAILFATYGDYRFKWRANYIRGEQGYPTEFFVDAPCYGLNVMCRPTANTGTYWTHSASITWAPRDWSLTLGIVNMFNEEPPPVGHGGPVIQSNNVPLGAGYDLLGRRVLFSVSKQF